MFFEPLGQLQCVFAVAGHTQMQRLDSLQKQKRVKWRHTRAHIAQQLDPCLEDIREIAEGFDVFEAVVARVRLGKFGEFAVCPVEIAGIDDNAADACAVAADELCAAMNNNIDAVFNRPEQVSAT